MMDMERERLKHDPQEQKLKSIGLCEECSDPIVIGEEYYKIDDLMYHEECIDNFKKVAGE